MLVECKRHRDPVKRDLVLALHAKLADVGAHKAMMFSTGGFQKGAVEYASEHGIALVVFRAGRATYETRDDGPDRELPSWVPRFRFEGESLGIADGGNVSVRVVNDDRLVAIRQFLGDP